MKLSYRQECIDLLVVSWLPHPELAVSDGGHAGSGLEGGPDGHGLGLGNHSGHCVGEWKDNCNKCPRVEEYKFGLDGFYL
jgi:hypothetical protein